MIEEMEYSNIFDEQKRERYISEVFAKETIVTVGRGKSNRNFEFCPKETIFICINGLYQFQYGMGFENTFVYSPPGPVSKPHREPIVYQIKNDIDAEKYIVSNFNRIPRILSFDCLRNGKYEAPFYYHHNSFNAILGYVLRFVGEGQKVFILGCDMQNQTSGEKRKWTSEMMGLNRLKKCFERKIDQVRYISCNENVNLNRFDLKNISNISEIQEEKHFFLRREPGEYGKMQNCENWGLTKCQDWCTLSGMKEMMFKKPDSTVFFDVGTHKNLKKLDVLFSKPVVLVGRGHSRKQSEFFGNRVNYLFVNHIMPLSTEINIENSFIWISPQHFDIVKKRIIETVGEEVYNLLSCKENPHFLSYNWKPGEQINMPHYFWGGSGIAALFYLYHFLETGKMIYLTGYDFKNDTGEDRDWTPEIVNIEELTSRFPEISGKVWNLSIPNKKINYHIPDELELVRDKNIKHFWR